MNAHPECKDPTAMPLPSRRWRWPAAVLPAISAALLLAACASAPPLPTLLSLPPAVATLATAPTVPAVPAAVSAPPGAATTAAPLLAIRRIAIPEYLVARRVRYRADPSTLAEWPNTFWAERIEIGVSREFLSALRVQLPEWSLCDATCGDALPTLALQVDLVPMDFVRAERQLQARARITVSSAGSNPAIRQTQELVYALPVEGDSAQAHAQAITELIRQVTRATAPLVRSNARP